MRNEAWFWANWKNLKTIQGIGEQHGMVLIALCKEAGFSDHVELQEADIEKISEILGMKVHVFKNYLNTLWQTGTLRKEGRKLFFPVGEELVSVEPIKKERSEDPEDVKEIFEFWEATMKSAYDSGKFKSKKTNFSGKMKLTTGRSDIIKGALKAYDKETLKKAILGASRDEFFMEEGHTDLNVLFRFNSKRSRNNIEHFASMNEGEMKGKWDVTIEGEEGEFEL